jgi:hypothetical protein
LRQRSLLIEDPDDERGHSACIALSLLHRLP